MRDQTTKKVDELLQWIDDNLTNRQNIELTEMLAGLIDVIRKEITSVKVRI